MNRRELIQNIGSGIAVGMFGVTTKVKAVAQNGNCGPPTHFEQTFPAAFISDCTGHLIFRTISEKSTVQTCTKADGTVTTKFHDQIHGTAQDQMTGTEYVVNQQVHQREVDFSGCQPSVTYNLQELLISKGNAPNERMVITLKFTFDSSCQPIDMTASIVSYCNGGAYRGQTFTVCPSLVHLYPRPRYAGRLLPSWVRRLLECAKTIRVGLMPFFPDERLGRNNSGVYSLLGLHLSNMGWTERNSSDG
jgi:hypothetical protein